MIDLDELERLAAEALKRPAVGEGHIACAMSVCTQLPAVLAELRTAREKSFLYGYMQKVAMANGFDCLTDAITKASNARELLREAADACDEVGVKHFDSDDLSPEVERMQRVTKRIRAALAEARP